MNTPLSNTPDGDEEAFLEELAAQKYLSDDEFSYRFLLSAIPEEIEHPPMPTSKEEWDQLQKLSALGTSALVEKAFKRYEDEQSWLAELNIYGVSDEIFVTIAGGIHDGRHERKSVYRCLEDGSKEKLGEMTSDDVSFTREEFLRKIVHLLREDEC